MPQSLLRKLGAEWSWFRLRYKHPSKSTIRSVLTRIDAAELDMITCAWLFAQARKSGNDEWEIAVDGKVMRLFEVNRDGVLVRLPGVVSCWLRCVICVGGRGCRRCGRACAGSPGSGTRMPGGPRVWRAGSGFRRRRS